ncbi:MAG TPA: hypothetical protein VL859_01445 [Flavobacterium sp.]|nr:hypothetical protein [Flavobacterium sp.]
MSLFQALVFKKYLSQQDTVQVQEQKKVHNLKSRINTNYKEIDKMIYKLYRLSEEKVTIVENS